MQTRRPVTRRTLLVAASTLAATAASVRAQSGPTVKILVGYAAGGPADAVARTIAEKMGPLIGRTVVVENRPGAGGQIAAQALKAAPADGATLMVTNTHTVALVPLTVKEAGFTSADFRSLGTVVDFDYAIGVHGSVPARTLAELSAFLAERRPGSAIGTPTQGSVPELIAQRLYAVRGAEPVLVPYKGSAPMIQDLLGGQVPAGIGSVFDFLPHIASGRLRVLAATREHPQLPGVPSFAQAGISGVELPDFLGLYAPARLGDDTATRLSQALASVSAMPDVVERFRQLGFSLAPAGAGDHAKRLAQFTQTLAALVPGASGKR